MYLAVCLSTLVLRKRDREIAAQVGAHFTDPLQAVAPPKFTVPFGPVIPVARVDRRARHPRRRDATRS